MSDIEHAVSIAMTSALQGSEKHILWTLRLSGIEDPVVLVEVLSKALAAFGAKNNRYPVDL